MAEAKFDPVALRERYAEERAKRLRAEGNEQYVEMADAGGIMVNRPGSIW